MQLDPGQRSILAYFGDDSSAQMAAEKLKQMGYTDIQIDEISRFPSRNAYNKSSNSSLSSMVFGSTDYDRSFGVLLAADPAASGTSIGYEKPGGFSFLVTLVTDNEKIPEAVNILKEYGAYV